MRTPFRYHRGPISSHGQPWGIRDKARTMTESPQHPVDLDLRMVRYFTVVAEHRHFGRAAATLRVTQSSQPAGPPTGAGPGCPAVQPDPAGHGANGSRRGLPAPLQDAAAFGRPGRGRCARRRRIQPHRHRPYHRDHRHPGRAQVAPTAPRRRCPRSALGLGPATARPARSPGRRRDLPAAVGAPRAARDDPVRRAAGAALAPATTGWRARHRSLSTTSPASPCRGWPTRSGTSTGRLIPAPTGPGASCPLRKRSRGQA